MERIARAMVELRSDPPETISGKPVLVREDIDSLERLNMHDGSVTKIDLPRSNVLRFILDDEAWVAVRPSGTEPKLKLYAGVRAECSESAEKLLKDILDFMEKRLSKTLYGN